MFVRPRDGYQIGHPGAFSGFGFEETDRQQYYDSTHPQTIEFVIAGEITRELTEASGNGRPGHESRHLPESAVARQGPHGHDSCAADPNPKSRGQDAR